MAVSLNPIFLSMYKSDEPIFNLFSFVFPEMSGLSTDASTRDFLQIGLLLCFCAIHSHGYKMLLSLSRVLKDTPYPPVGFTILRTGLNKSVLLSVYSSQNFGIGRPSSSSNGMLVPFGLLHFSLFSPRLGLTLYSFFFFLSFFLLQRKGFQDISAKLARSFYPSTAHMEPMWHF